VQLQWGLFLLFCFPNNWGTLWCSPVTFIDPDTCSSSSCQT
jgi:hypothetical protein